MKDQSAREGRQHLGFGGPSPFADDCALFFNFRADLVTSTSYRYSHLSKFGLMMHVGSGDVVSKTEAMYFSRPRTEYSEADTSRLMSSTY